MAPELIDGAPSTPKVDMWALGIILYQFFSNRFPFEAKNNYELQKQIKESEPAPLQSIISPFINELILKLLDKNPDSRPDA